MRRIVLLGIVGLSGFAALTFETLWFHQAGIGLGNGVWASSVVLAGFMAGIGIGNALTARIGDRLARPLRTYALLEVLVALIGTAVVFLLPTFGGLVASAVSGSSPVVMNIVRLLVAFGVLCVPSVAMGMTLPVLTRALSGAGVDFGAALGELYAVNTLGAMLGALTADFVLIETLGIPGSAIVAGLCDLAAAAGALALSNRFGALPRQEAPALPSAAGGGPFLLATFAFGFGVLALEVVWFRFLKLYLEASTGTFAMMLAVVLLGIGVGGWLGGRLLAVDEEGHRYAPVVACLCTIATVAGYLACRWTVLAVGNGRPDGLADDLLIGVPLMLPVCIGSGILFPLLGAAIREHVGQDAAAVGLLTLANTMGAALGSLVAGFVLLPVLGVEQSMFLLAVLFLVVGIGLALVEPTGRRFSAMVAITAMLGLAIFPHGMMEKFHIPARAAWFSGTIAGVSEGLTETVVYVQNQFHGEPTSYRMVTNSHSMAATDWTSRRYMKLYTWFAVALKPDIESALLVSYGCGQTAKSLTDTESLQTIHVADISREVVQMNSVVFPPDELPTNDPRMDVFIGDGRWFMQTTDHTYDLITSEPPPLLDAGTVNLYTQEYFQLVHDKLQPDGIVTYWLPLSGMTDRSMKSIVKAFCNVFDDCSLWQAYQGNLMLVGTRGGLAPVSAEAFTAQWRDPEVREELASVGFEEPEQIGALFLGDSTWLKGIVADWEPLRDDYPKRIAEGFSSTDPAARARYPKWDANPDSPFVRPYEYPTHSHDVDAPNALFQSWVDPDEGPEQRFQTSEWIQELWPASIRERTPPWFAIQRALEDRFHERVVDLQVIEDVLQDGSLPHTALLLLGSDPDTQRVLDALSAEQREHPEVQYHLGARALAQGRPAEAIAHFEAARAHEPLAEDARTFTELSKQLVEQARAAEEASAEEDPVQP